MVRWRTAQHSGGGRVGSRIADAVRRVSLSLIQLRTQRVQTRRRTTLARGLCCVSKLMSSMSEQDSLRVGLVGCGNHGGALAQAIVRSDLLRLVACADPDELAVHRAAALSGNVSVHASLDALLASTAVDAVVIATPHHLLAPMALASIRA